MFKLKYVFDLKVTMFSDFWSVKCMSKYLLAEEREKEANPRSKNSFHFSMDLQKKINKTYQKFFVCLSLSITSRETHYKGRFFSHKPTLKEHFAIYNIFCLSFLFDVASDVHSTNLTFVVISLLDYLRNFQIISVARQFQNDGGGIMLIQFLQFSYLKSVIFK